MSSAFSTRACHFLALLRFCGRARRWAGWHWVRVWWGDGFSSAGPPYHRTHDPGRWTRLGSLYTTEKSKQNPSTRVRKAANVLAAKGALSPGIRHFSNDRDFSCYSPLHSLIATEATVPNLTPGGCFRTPLPKNKDFWAA
jgi:hypothetical protein